MSSTQRRYKNNSFSRKKNFNNRDLIALIIFAIATILYVKGWTGMHVPFTHDDMGGTASLKDLAYDSLRTTMRLVIGMFFSFVFAIVFGVAAAKNKHLSRFILPFINFMESVPLLGFMTFSTLLLMSMYPGNVMGLEAVAIFGVFTGQAWNMALTVYQTLVIVPKEVDEAARMFQLSPWQKLWKLEIPFSIPGLLWNTMVSQSAAWFAILGSEIIPLAMGKQAVLPGVGSYIQQGLDNANNTQIVLGTVAIILNIILFDQLFFRPLVRWAEKYKMENTARSIHNTSWFFNVLTQATFLQNYIARPLKTLGDLFVNGPKRFLPSAFGKIYKIPAPVQKVCVALYYIGFAYLLIEAGIFLYGFLSWKEASHLLPLMGYTTLRVTIAMLISIIMCVPLGVIIGLNEKATRICQPIIQIGAALPPDIYFPIITIMIIVHHQSLNLWTIPLIWVGTAWYVLFNVIAGVQALPQEMRELAVLFKLKGWTWWKRFMIPAIFPYIVCGIVSAAGGAWNSDIAAEFLSYGGKDISVTGLGDYVAMTTGDPNATGPAAIGVLAMCFLVFLCIVFVWTPLYRLSERRFNFN